VPFFAFAKKSMASFNFPSAALRKQSHMEHESSAMEIHWQTIMPPTEDEATSFRSPFDKETGNHHFTSIRSSGYFRAWRSPFVSSSQTVAAAGTGEGTDRIRLSTLVAIVARVALIQSTTSSLNRRHRVLARKLISGFHSRASPLAACEPTSKSN